MLGAFGAIRSNRRGQIEHLGCNIADGRGVRCSGRCLSAPLERHVARLRRVLRDAHRVRLAGRDLFDHRAVQERPLARSRALPAARLADQLDLEGRHEHNARTLADLRPLRLRRLDLDVVRGQLSGRRLSRRPQNRPGQAPTTTATHSVWYWGTPPVLTTQRM